MSRLYGDGGIAMAEAIPNILERIAIARSSGVKLLGIPTGFSKLDELTLGWQSPDVITIEARPGVGKSALASDIAKAAAQAGVEVYFASLEMSVVQYVCAFWRVSAGSAAGH